MSSDRFSTIRTTFSVLLKLPLVSLDYQDTCYKLCQILFPFSNYGGCYMEGSQG